ncbi:MAG: glycosyltransferase family 2 protein [Clostridiales bacterium]|nr:glycosyltransferase family 2 protein [Clostridiales bacterium]
MLISFVIPCYRSEKTLPQVVGTIQETLKTRKDFDSEIILVNDASPDDTWGTIKSLCSSYDNVKGINLAKNCGQQAAIMAGLRHTKGDLVAVSDDDGQTPIETVFEFYDCMEEGGYDVVCADYQDRGRRSLFRRLGSWADNTMMRMAVDRPEDIRLSVYFLAKRFVVDEIIKYNNAYPHMEGLLLRTTLNIGNVKVDQKERTSGSSGYNFKKLLSTWVNGLTTFSIKPLRLAVILGMLMALAGFIIIVALVVVKIAGPEMEHGWTSLVATNILIGGMIMMILGVIGEYVGRIYLCLNQNPQYVVKEIIDDEEK